jgi:hypothetical protein
LQLACYSKYQVMAIKFQAKLRNLSEISKISPQGKSSSPSLTPGGITLSLAIFVNQMESTFSCANETLELIYAIKANISEITSVALSDCG